VNRYLSVVETSASTCPKSKNKCNIVTEIIKNGVKENLEGENYLRRVNRRVNKNEEVNDRKIWVEKQQKHCEEIFQQ